MTNTLKYAYTTDGKNPMTDALKYTYTTDRKKSHDQYFEV